MRRRLREILPHGAAILAAIVAIGSVRGRLFDAHKHAKNEHDVYFLPPPEQVVTMAMGYRAAMADVLWAHVLVSQGLHTFERRRFENLTRLYDAINALDPTWRQPYLLADALITFQSAQTPVEEVQKAREILERGVEHRPFDGEIWLNLGQFVSFVAPASYLEDYPEMAARWRREGVAYLARATELGSANSKISWQAIGGGSILLRAGEREAAIRFYERAYAATDDPELKEHILELLQKKLAERHLERYRRWDEAFKRGVEADLGLPLTGPPGPGERDLVLLLGPPLAPARCAGLGPEEKREGCYGSWQAWSDAMVKGAETSTD
ncbi:MAG: hypothetical protein R3B72_17510 [Polyangiaceae bacterium]